MGTAGFAGAAGGGGGGGGGAATLARFASGARAAAEGVAAAGLGPRASPESPARRQRTLLSFQGEGEQPVWVSAQVSASRNSNTGWRSMSTYLCKKTLKVIMYGSFC
jgi:hypothetical protein